MHNSGQISDIVQVKKVFVLSEIWKSDSFSKEF